MLQLISSGAVVPEAGTAIRIGVVPAHSRRRRRRGGVSGSARCGDKADGGACGDRATWSPAVRTNPGSARAYHGSAAIAIDAATRTDIHATAHDDRNFADIGRAVHLCVERIGRRQRRSLRWRAGRKQAQRRRCSDEKGSVTSYWISHQIPPAYVIALVGRSLRAGCGTTPGARAKIRRMELHWQAFGTRNPLTKARELQRAVKFRPQSPESPDRG